MKLANNWAGVMRGAWSIRLMALASVFSGLQVFFELVSPDLLGIGPIIFAALAAVASAGAMVARLIFQVFPPTRQKSFFRDESGWIRRRSIGLITAVSIAAGAAFVAPWEGLRTQSYQDIVGRWTVCFGETKGVRPGDTYTTAQCEAMLSRELAAYATELGQCLTAKLPEGAAVAFLSLSYNVGVPAVCRSTLVRMANAGDLFGACDQLLRWDKATITGADGKRLKIRVRGLTNRRKAEREICLKSLKLAGLRRADPK